MQKNILFVRKIWKHHTQSSGYDIIFKEFNGNNYFHYYLIDEKNLLFKVINKIFTAVFGFKNYTFTTILDELFIIIKVVIHDISLIHFTYLESNFKLLKILKKVVFIGTIHLPSIFYKIGLQGEKNFNNMATLIVLDENSKHYFQKYFPVVFIPHPVNTSYFKPLESGEKFEEFTCLCVGRLLRDIDTFFKVVKLSRINRIQDIHFVLVHPIIDKPTHLWYKILGYGDLDTVTYYTHLSDLQLLECYQRSHVLLMPLFDSTANNTILEAMSCGLPIISNNVGGINNYVDDSFGFLHEIGDAVSMLKSVLILKNNISLYKQYATTARTKAIKNFSINDIMCQTEKLYKNILYEK